jgi:hypothetical protein
MNSNMGTIIILLVLKQKNPKVNRKMYGAWPGVTISCRGASEPPGCKKPVCPDKLIPKPQTKAVHF